MAKPKNNKVRPASNQNKRRRNVGLSQDNEGTKPPAEAGSQSISGQAGKRQKKMTSFQKAKLVYDRIQEERRQQREKEKLEREQRQKSIAVYNKSRQKMNHALAKKNKKGQPNLGAQVEVLLEKLQRRVDKDKKK